MSSASDQKLFCEVCSAFKCSLDAFVGEKVVSPSCSSTILAPPPCLDLKTSIWRLLLWGKVKPVVGRAVPMLGDLEAVGKRRQYLSVLRISEFETIQEEGVAYEFLQILFEEKFPELYEG